MFLNLFLSFIVATMASSVLWEPSNSFHVNELLKKANLFLISYKVEVADSGP